ncbi:hypothetical protein BSY240_1950 [Agrobacterium sp. RAC06]|nr:hypothetical protein BSY240_1950 [Agrobacterium sp. RAC06]
MGHVSGAARTDVLHARSHMPCALAATGSEDTYVTETDTMRWSQSSKAILLTVIMCFWLAILPTFATMAALVREGLA